MTSVICVYVCLGTPAGYVSATIYKSEFTVTMIIMMIIMRWFLHVENRMVASEF